MKDDKVFIRHMLDEINFIVEKSEDLELQQLMKDEILTRAFIRSLEVIGEASKNISLDFKERHSEIPWRELAALRDKLIHHYFGVNWNIVWDIVKNLMPKLRADIKAIMRE